MQLQVPVGPMTSSASMKTSSEDDDLHFEDEDRLQCEVLNFCDDSLRAGREVVFTAVANQQCNFHHASLDLRRPGCDLVSLKWRRKEGRFR